MGLRERFGRYTDMVLAGGIVSVIALLIVPLPATLLAFLQVLNLSAALTVLLVAIYSRQALEFSVFPSLLLVTTLLRLGLNISATRLILTGGDAGAVIDAFGNFVVGGNFVIGIVIFLILTVIQFVVITNGSGRVAEVAARFTLDAMPGKQMAIDADLNAGIITQEQAQERRKQIQREADFFGAMDGASKFVKGDAVAGIIIILINIVGGIIVGMLQLGLDINTALSKFTLLTVGDGLVTQIPALLISTATGIIVTRTGDGASTNLGREILTQMIRNPRALGTASALVGLMGVVPGMPMLPFLSISAAGIGGAWYAGRLQQNNAGTSGGPTGAAKDGKGDEAKPESQSEALMNLLEIDPMELEVGLGLIGLVDKGQGANFLTRITLIRRQIAQELGIITPTIRIHDNLTLPPNAYAIKMRGVVIAEGELLANHYLAMNAGLATEALDGIPTKEPTFGLPAVWITAALKDRAEMLQYTVVDAPSVLATHLTEVIKANAWLLLSKRDTRQLLDHVKETNAVLVEDLVPNILSVGEVQGGLQCLLRERVCIRDLQTILEAFGNAARVSKEPDVLAERARMALARAICTQYQGPDKALHVITLPHDVEVALAQNVERTENGPSLSIDAALIHRLLEGIAAAIERSAIAGNQPVILVSSRIRLALRRLIERHLPTQAVLSYDEITMHPNVTSDGAIDVTQKLAGVAG